MFSCVGLIRLRFVSESSWYVNCMTRLFIMCWLSRCVFKLVVLLFFLVLIRRLIHSLLSRMRYRGFLKNSVLWLAFFVKVKRLILFCSVVWWTFSGLLIVRMKGCGSSLSFWVILIGYGC